MEVKLYNQEGKEAGALELSEKIFNFPWKPQLVHEAMRTSRQNQRKNSAHTKDRSEVSGGGRKPWRQKGTGRARHGSIRSPIWIGGGVSHGPRGERMYSLKINKKARREALFSILSQKLRENEVLFLDNLKIDEAKTKKGSKLLKNISKISGFEKVDPKASTLVILGQKDRTALRALRNIPNVTVSEARNLNPILLLTHKFLVLPQEAGRILEETFLKQNGA